MLSATRGVQKVLQLDHKEEWKYYKLQFVFTCVSYAEARNRYRLDVRLSVSLSHAGTDSTVSKRLNVLS